MSFAHEEIVELFDEVQANHAADVARDLIRGCVYIRTTRRKGAFKSPQRKAYNRAFTAVALHEHIKQRILAGERPKTGGPGRPPTRWWRVADELGIDIGQPKPTAAEDT